MRQQTELLALEVWTEGKTDWIHLKTAMRELGIELPIKFHECTESMGDAKLKSTCATFAQRSHAAPIVFIFDRDNDSIIRDVSDPHNSYKSWGNNVYSFVLPKPAHRRDYSNLSIEFFYKDHDLLKLDNDGRRLYLTSEFNEQSGKLIDDPSVNVANAKSLRKSTQPTSAKIVDSEVFDAQNRSIALTKARFAEYLAEGAKPFDSVDYTAFDSIFEILRDIGRAVWQNRSICLPNLDQLMDELKDKPQGQQIGRIFDYSKRLICLALELFMISTIRFYETAIINEPPEYKKKVRPVRLLLSNEFVNPSFHTIVDMAKKCFHLVDSTAPATLRKMKMKLDEDFLLSHAGQAIDDLETLFPPKRGQARQTNKARIRRSLIRYWLDEYAKYAGKSISDIEEAFDLLPEEKTVDLTSWYSLLGQLSRELSPFLLCPIEQITVTSTDPQTGTYTVEIKRYSGNEYQVRESEISSDEVEDYQSSTTRLLLSDDKAIHVHPMLLVKDNALYFYQRSRAIGYEYYSFANNTIHIEKTKRKFDRSIFRVGSTQELFWTDVVPSTNPTSGIRANIPQEGLDDFVGRERQKKRILEEVLEIPNENGIVYGPGGIGKTALMQQLTHELYTNSAIEDKLFDNIIWVSAKADYYDYIFGTTQSREQYSRSFDDVLTAILQFFEFSDADEYDFEDKKYFVMELLEDERTLLVLDNLETIPRPETERILRFFGTDVKRRLRLKPDFFKVIVTSRAQIPTGFKQIPLKGLDVNESLQLMRLLQEHYRQELTDQQMRDIHDATFGIPIVIKHCFGQLFEYRKPLSRTLRGLTNYESNIVQFSYEEILKQLERKDRSGIQLKLLLLLDLINYPLMIRQIAEVIGVSEEEIESQIPILASFQCIEAVFQDSYEKYMLNSDIRILVKALAQRHMGLVDDIRKTVSSSSVDNEIDASTEELHLANMFETYLTEGQFLEAEDFINQEIDNRKGSVLLSYRYARFLTERRRHYEKALGILEDIREASHNHPHVLALLIRCYMSLDIPKYEAAELYVRQVGDYAAEDPDLAILLAEYYMDWSTSLKLGRELDLLDEKLRQQQYKDLASKALEVLELVPANRVTDRYYYMCAQCFYNKWQYDEALRLIDQAIAITDAPQVYEKFRARILLKKQTYN